MEPAAFFRSSRIVVVAGKGGAGRTTVASALAWAAADAGLSVLLVELEGKSGIATAFECPDLGYEPAVLREAGAGRHGSVAGRRITPDDALLEYLDDHGMKRLGTRLGSTGTLDVIATATPGMKDILILGKLKQLANQGHADLVVLDAPATGHALAFLCSPGGLAHAVRSGPIRRQADEVVSVLTDPAMCQVVLVTLAEATPVTETVDLAFALEEQVGVALGPVVVNALLEPAPSPSARVLHALPGPQADALRRACAFERARIGAQQRHRERLAERLPLPQVPLGFADAAIGRAQLARLAAELAAGITKASPLR